MAPLAVDPVALDGAGTAVVSAGEGLGSVVSTLSATLGGCKGMAGDDPAGAAFGRSYDDSARKLLEAMAATRNGLCSLGYGVRMSAHNYSLAEAMSNVSGRGEPPPIPHPSAAVSAGSTPSAVGSGVGAPAGWGWVAPFIGMIWPNGDSAKLRAAAAAWISAGTNFEATEITGIAGPMGRISAQQIPEGSAIAAAFGDASRSAAGILQQCVSIAAQLGTYAAKIDRAHAAILDLLSRICDPMTGLKEVWEFLTDQDEDEIKKIANDIRTIVEQFTAEVDALRQQIAIAVTEAETILTTMARYAEKEWDHFLHGTDVGKVLDGVATEAGGLVKALWTNSLPRLLVDPQGFYQSVSDELNNLSRLVGLDGEESCKESWKALGKDITHWDEWSENPFKAAGETLFDVGTLALPGGPISKLPKVGQAMADAARGLRDVRLPRPHVEPEAKAPAPPHAEPAPKPPAPSHDKPTSSHEQPGPAHEPAAGRPASALQPKVGPPQPDSTPRGPVESKSPSTGGPLQGEGPRAPEDPSDPGQGPPPPPGGSPPPPGQGPPPPEPHPPMPGASPGESGPPTEPPSTPPPADGAPAAAPPQPAPASPSAEGPPPTEVPHRPPPSPPSGVGHLPSADQPQQPAVPSTPDHTPGHAEHQPIAAPPEQGHPAHDGDHAPATGSPALAPVSAGPHSAELATKADHTPPAKPTESSGRPSNLPDAGRVPASNAESPGGRPTSPPLTSSPNGDPAVGHPSKGAPLNGRHSGLNDGTGSRATEPGGSHSGNGHGGHGDPDGGGHSESAAGLSTEKRDEILAMEKGTRPDPFEYLPPEYIEHHLDKFHDGATRFMPQSNFDKYGIAQRDGTSFVMPKNEADALVDATRGDPRALEKSLGLPNGFLDSKKLVRIDISHPHDFNLRMPSGNEAGANEQWIPGGLLPDGAAEAVIDGGEIPASGYSVSEVPK